MNILFVLFQVLTTLGFILALVLLLHILRERRSPASTFAWLLAIILMPYAGVPLYIMFGGRKMKQMAGSKANLPEHTMKTPEELPCVEKYLPGGVTSLFPLRGCNNVNLLTTGEAAYRDLLDSIESARTSISITTFILGRDETGKAILKALARKARDGVEVRLLLDALGSFHVSENFLSKFTEAGGKHAFFMPMIALPFRGRANLRNHRKMVIIDCTTAIIGGMNLSRDYMSAEHNPGLWRDISISVEGPIIDDLIRVFESDWNFAAKETTTAPSPLQAVPETNGDIPLQLVPSGPDVEGDPLHDSILSSIFTAQKRISIVTPYFIPDEMMIKALCIAAKRGIEITIVVPKVSNHRLADMVRRSYLRQVQLAGGKIYQYDQGMVHGKLIIIDYSLGIIGTMNMDMRSFFLNYELALFVFSDHIVNQLDSWVGNLLEKSSFWEKKGGVTVEFIEGIARLFSPLL